MSNEHTNAENGHAQTGSDGATESDGAAPPEESAVSDPADDAIVVDDAIEVVVDDGMTADVDGPAQVGPPDQAAAERSDIFVPVEAAASTGDVPPQYGVGPFSIREVSLAGVWLVAFVVSFFPIYGTVGVGPTVWDNGIDWVLTIGAPTIAVFLLVLRRLSPQGIRRVGSLGLDQFASVVFSVSSIVWLGILWGAFVSLARSGVFIATWIVWVELILMLAGVVLTVIAPVLPVFGEDFRYRSESVAHRNARMIRPVARRSVSVRPRAADAAPIAQQPRSTAPSANAAPSDATAPFDATTTNGDVVSADTASDGNRPTPSQAFWALVPVERDIVDADGAPVFRIGPTAWALVIEDRGTSFVVRHDDGRVGYLHDVSGVTRG